MTTRESLHELVDQLSEWEAEELWRKLQREAPHPARKDPRVLDVRDYPALEAVWDNADDAIFDAM